MSFIASVALYHNGVCSARLLFTCTKRRHAKLMTKNNQLLSNRTLYSPMGVCIYGRMFIQQVIEWFVLCWQAVIVEVLSHHQKAMDIEKNPVSRKTSLNWSAAGLKIKLLFCVLFLFKVAWTDFILKGIVLLQFCLSFCLYLDADIGGSSHDLCVSTVCKTLSKVCRAR